MSDTDETTITVTDPADLKAGQTIEVAGLRYTVDSVDLDENIGAVVRTTSGARLELAWALALVVETRSIPSKPTEPEARPAGTTVHHWSGSTLPAPGALARRDEIRPGDVVQSSHGYRIVVTTVDGGHLVGTMHSPEGSKVSERYDPHTLIPVLSRTVRPAAEVDVLVNDAREAFDVLLAADPAAAYGLFTGFIEDVRDAPYERLIVDSYATSRVGAAASDVADAALRDPYTGELTYIQIVDIADRRSTEAEGLDRSGNTLRFHSAGSANSDELVFISVDSARPVRLPEGWAARGA